MSDLQDKTGMIPEPLEAKADRTPPSTAGMTTKVVKGSLWTLAGQVAPLGVSLVTTPFTIRLLGAEGYGVLILVGLIPTYLGFADFGMSMASTKFGSEAYAEGDEEKEGRIVRTAALIALMTSVPVAALLIFFAGQIIGMFNVPPELSSDAVLALRLASITFVINFLCGIFNTPQLARLRMDLNTFINASSRILGLLATPLVLYLGYGIVGAVAVLFIASLINLAGHLFISHGLLPHILGTTIDRIAAGAMARFGYGIVIAVFAGLLLTNAERGVLAFLVSPEALAFYAVAFTLANMITLFSASMLQALIPAFSQLQTVEKRSQLQSIYSRGIRISLVWALPILAFLILIAKPFFTIWAGVDFGEGSAIPFYLISIGLFINIIAYMPHAVILAAGRSDILAKIYWLELFPYLFVVWFLVSRFGLYGAAAAWSIRIIADAIIQSVMAGKIAGVSPPTKGYIGFIFGILVMGVPIMLMFFLGDRYVLVIAAGLMSLAIYAFIVWKAIIPDDEQLWFTNLVRSRLAR
ncbi:MAG TPA: hypothetical protein DDW24_11490 [Blastocatellia bacterium]|nr:hypothetical protein [Blastocatellia bacterium]